MLTGRALLHGKVLDCARGSLVLASTKSSFLMVIGSFRVHGHSVGNFLLEICIDFYIPERPRPQLLVGFSSELGSQPEHTVVSLSNVSAPVLYW